MRDHHRAAPPPPRRPRPPWPRTSRARSASPTSSGSGRNLGISLLHPGRRDVPGRARPVFVATVVAIVAGTVIGCVLLGLRSPGPARSPGRTDHGAAARPARPHRLVPADGAQPAAVRRLGHVRDRDHRRGAQPAAPARRGGRTCWSPGRWPPLMALRPLGSVRVLARYAVWRRWPARCTCSSGCSRQPLPAGSPRAPASFWTATDIVIALPVSWFPLVADYTRPRRARADRVRRHRHRVRRRHGRLLHARRAGAAPRTARPGWT